MRIPRDITGRRLITSLQPYGYSITRQKGSHIRITTSRKGTHHITIPDHNTLRICTISSILNEVCKHFKISKEELLKDLFG